MHALVWGFFSGKEKLYLHHIKYAFFAKNIAMKVHLHLLTLTRNKELLLIFNAPGDYIHTFLLFIYLNM